MFTTGAQLLLISVALLSFGQAAFWSRRPANDGICGLKGNSRNSQAETSTSGISFRALSVDRAGGAWMGGSVFGIEGLLLKSKARVTTAIAISSVKYIQDLSFPSVRKGWMVADNRLYQTNDRGISWRNVHATGLAARLKSVSFADTRLGWVAGSEGLILHTTDGGVSWSPQDSGTSFTIERIRFVNQDHGWAIGSDISPPETRKVLLLTKDGGRTWKKNPEIGHQQFRSVIFLSSHSGWAVSDKDEVLQTSDGGATWVVRRGPDGTALEAVFFLNESIGWVVGNDIIKTIDGGKTWKHQAKTTGTDGDSLDHVMFADARHGWAIGLTRILTTHNGGTTWKPLPNSWKADILSRIRREKFNSSSIDVIPQNPATDIDKTAGAASRLQQKRQRSACPA